jgi:quercetin dioxygenase-like cupin family protein
MMDVILRRFDRPDETRTFSKGQFDLVRIGGLLIGRATYEPGWKWSLDVGARTGRRFCATEHVGIVIAGSAAAEKEDGRVVEMTAGDLFHIAPGHDSWVIGQEPYVSLHFVGAAEYTR